MWKQLLQWVGKWCRPASPPTPTPAPDSRGPVRFERLVLTDQVSAVLFDDFAAHRQTFRGDEEIGWMLLGQRLGNVAVARATLPAGTHRSAGVAHVSFNSTAQALAARILRLRFTDLRNLGVVHTHPGSLRRPSGGDYKGDSGWVSQLPGGEGVFGIGTADAEPGAPAADFQQVAGEACFSWYALAASDEDYRPLPVTLEPGPDLAQPLHAVWDTLEAHAEPLERLLRQLRHVAVQTMQLRGEPALSVTVSLADPGQRLQIVLQNDEAWYYVERGKQLSAVDPDEPSLERAVYRIMAELAQPSVRAASPSRPR